MGLVDGEDLIRTKPASTASLLLFLWRFYALLAKRTHLPRADLSSNTHVGPLVSQSGCYLEIVAISFSVQLQMVGLLLSERRKRLFSDTLSRFERQLWGTFAPRVFERIITNCETVACRVLLLQTWQFRSGPAGLGAASG